MKKAIAKAYKGILGFVDNFANSTAGDTVPQHQKIDERQSSVPDYACPCDNYINSLLENKLTKKALRSIAKRYYGGQIDGIILDSPKLTAVNYPRLYQNYNECCSILAISEVPEVFITSHLFGINALSVEHENKSLILLSYMAVIALNDLEQKFLLGHELGHIQQGHMIAHTVQGLLQDLNLRSEIFGPIATDIIDVPLNRWYRTSELTADRAGYLCCKDITVVEDLFKKLNLETIVTALSQYKELSEAHPSVSTRLELLKQFADISIG